jgi:type IV fimbrial biogenesis protein FimT
MLKRYQRIKSSGFTLVELMVTVALIAILMKIALPSFNNLMRSARIRAAAEAVNNGLQKARGEAIAQNKNVEFILGADTSWTVKLAGSVTPIQTRPASEGSADVTRTVSPAGTTKVTFNNLGRVITPNADGSLPLSTITTSISGVKSMAVIIQAGGNSKMCDPSLAAGSSPRACS